MADDLLTPRQQEIVELMAEGLTRREIAKALGISPETVKDHADFIRARLNARSMTHAVAIFLMHTMRRNVLQAHRAGVLAERARRMGAARR